MQSVRAVAELGQMIRAENALKVRQPLAELQVQNIDLEEWMSALLMDELNIKAIKSTAKISSSKGYIQASSPDGQLNVAMRTELTPELEAEGLLRELIRTIQSLRKQAGLDMGDKVSITYSTTNKQIVEVIENNMAELKSAVFANAISEGDAKEKVVVNGNEVNITLHQ
jgi:isoleucyl-tRNA synthetase